jgi:hypothetical protein
VLTDLFSEFLVVAGFVSWLQITDVSGTVSFPIIRALCLQGFGSDKRNAKMFVNDDLEILELEEGKKIDTILQRREGEAATRFRSPALCKLNTLVPLSGFHFIGMLKQ